YLDAEITREKTFQRQTTFIGYVPSSLFAKNRLLMWVTCFFRQFGHSVVRSDYLILRKGFITNHHLSPRYDFHSYMIRSMEEEFPSIVGVSGPLWGFVVAFMLFNIKGSNLYFWIAIIPITLVLLVGTKLQHVIATLTLENAGISGYFAGAKLKPRDDLFWFKKPELLLSLIHFILFQWQFGYNSCFIRNHTLVYIRLILG
ncbi:MLO-like protein 14, partial [Linum perenne]